MFIQNLNICSQVQLPNFLNFFMDFSVKKIKTIIFSVFQFLINLAEFVKKLKCTNILLEK